MDRKNSSAVSFKAEAKALRKYLAEQGIELGHSKCLEAISRSRGFKDWNTASATGTTKVIPAKAATGPVPYAVVMSRTDWVGDPMGWDVFDYFARSILHEDDESVSGHPDAVEVHAALVAGQAVRAELATRVLAICYSEEELDTAWERLRDAFKHTNPTRRAALWRVFHNEPYPYPERLGTEVLKTPLFMVSNHHAAACGEPPCLNGDKHGYFSYFENSEREQAVFRWDRRTKRGMLYMGDAGWDHPIEVDGRGRTMPNTVLDPAERMWLRSCLLALGALPETAHEKVSSKEDAVERVWGFLQTYGRIPREHDLPEVEAFMQEQGSSLLLLVADNVKRADRTKA